MIISAIARFHRQVLLALILVIGVMGYFATQFQIDASADTLINENDSDYIYSEKVDARYAGDDVLFAVVKPEVGLFTQDGLALVQRIKQALLKVEGITTITSLFDVPLINTNAHPKANKAGLDLFLRDDGVDILAAKAEFQSSPLYQDLIVSKDGLTTAFQISYDPSIFETFDRKHAFLQKIRNILASYESEGKMHLGGLEVIADDMVGFLSQDLKIFGSLVLLAMVIILAIIFRNPRWIFISLGCCLSSAVIMMGILGIMGWKVTVVSSNFISLQMILTMSLTLHLIVKFFELTEEHPNESQAWLVVQTVSQKVVPSLVATVTTITGFAALVFSGIKPVESFGWMMIAGLAVTFVTTILLFMTILMCLPKVSVPETHSSLPLVEIAKNIYRIRWIVVAVSIVLLILGGMGIKKLSVENSFINYFKKSTELHKGLAFIDKNLGGTTPLSITIKFPEDAIEQEAESSEVSDTGMDFFDDFEDDYTGQNTNENFFITLDKVNKIRAVHEYLDNNDAIGKVQSIWTTYQIASQINGGDLDNFSLAILPKILPQSLRKTLIDAFVAPADNEMRISVRILDSKEGLRRNDLLKTIRVDLVEKFGFKAENVKLSGAMVLYNNILQRLFKSQIETLGFVLIAIVVLLFVLLRNLKLALIAVIPNVLSVAVILGLMGWLNIPLDIMTITIASITVGIAIDDAIHYIYRFKKEVMNKGDYMRAIMASHKSVGQAMVFTTLTISLGFGVLVFSNFIPNIIFGLLTAVAMFIALIASLTLMAASIVIIEPFKVKKK